MNTQTRLIALLCGLLGVFALSIGLFRVAQKRETTDYLAQTTRERSSLTDRLLELTGQSLLGFTNDYSNWSEMYQFVDKPDPAWATVNIDASLPNFDTHAAWVICPDGKLVHGAVNKIDESLRTPPFAPADLLPYLRRVKFAHFFVRTSAGVLEVRTAPIQPSEDTARKTAPHGWLIAARLWNHEHLQDLRQVLESDVRIDDPATPAPETHANEITFARPLTDWTGQSVGTLRIFYHFRTADELAIGNYRELALFLGFGVVVLAVAVIGVSHWVVRPLRRLEQSLAANSPEPLRTLAPQSDIFGRLATLVAGSFQHRTELEREIADRRCVELALRQSQDELRQSSNLKVRLARDLHDGVIQSIYAAGLGLEGVRMSLRADPAAAERKLDAAQTALNQTIREVRSFINGLEPDESTRPDFAQALRSLVTTLRTLHPVEFELHNELAPAALSVREEVHALQIVRECVSNALRHGEARHLRVHLHCDGGRPVLGIHDDGHGFDPTTARRGSGLANVAARAAEIGATLQIDSSPGKGTDITLRLAQRN